jgi:hypothetical protein
VFFPLETRNSYRLKESKQEEERKKKKKKRAHVPFNAATLYVIGNRAVADGMHGLFCAAA